MGEGRRSFRSCALRNASPRKDQSRGICLLDAHRLALGLRSIVSRTLVLTPNENSLCRSLKTNYDSICKQHLQIKEFFFFFFFFFFFGF